MLNLCENPVVGIQIWKFENSWKLWKSWRFESPLAPQNRIFKLLQLSKLREGRNLKVVVKVLKHPVLGIRGPPPSFGSFEMFESFESKKKILIPPGSKKKGCFFPKTFTASKTAPPRFESLKVLKYPVLGGAGGFKSLKAFNESFEYFKSGGGHRSPKTGLSKLYPPPDLKFFKVLKNPGFFLGGERGDSNLFKVFNEGFWKLPNLAGAPESPKRDFQNFYNFQNCWEGRSFESCKILNEKSCFGELGDSNLSKLSLSFKPFKILKVLNVLLKNKGK